jgi:hypothetical protein
MEGLGDEFEIIQENLQERDYVWDVFENQFPRKMEFNFNSCNLMVVWNPTCYHHQLN